MGGIFAKAAVGVNLDDVSVLGDDGVMLRYFGAVFHFVSCEVVGFVGSLWLPLTLSRSAPCSYQGVALNQLALWSIAYSTVCHSRKIFARS